MIRTEIMTFGHTMWDRTAAYADGCSWKAGAVLAKKMRENDFADNERVIAAIENQDIAAFCTFSNKDELPPESAVTPLIGFVFVGEQYRGQRLAGKLIDAACGIASEQGFSAIYILSGEIGLYEKYGFRKIGEVETIYHTVEQLFVREI